jgi:hypothetical protein
MRRLLLLLTALLLLPGLEQASARASASVDGAARKPLLATRDIGPAAQLYFADPISLRPLGARSLRLGFHWGDFARSPDGSMLALSRNDAAELRFVHLRGRLRFAGSMTFQGSFVRLLAWPSAHRLLVLRDPAPQRVLAIDPIAQKVLWQRSIGGSVLNVERSRDLSVALIAPSERIGPATLITIGLDGSLRSVELDRIFAGFQRDASSSDPVAETRLPGFAVDPDGNRAFVNGDGNPVAQVDLAAMSVTYHGPTRTLAKAVSGPQRQAIWLSNGMLAVVGSDSSVRRDPQGNVSQAVTASGLLLIDTRTWAARMLQEDAAGAMAIGGSLLAYGSSYDSASRTRTGFGLTIYGLDGTRRVHLFGRTPIDSVEAQGGFGYVWLPDRAGHVVVIDPKSGRVLANVTRPSIALLIRR